jgi:hypothetical protein
MSGAIVRPALPALRPVRGPGTRNGWRRRGHAVALAVAIVLHPVLPGGATTARDDAPPPLVPRDPALTCREMGGAYIAQADARRSFGDPAGGVSVVLPGAEWCEVRDGPYAARFSRFSNIVALRDAGRGPTPSEYAHTFFLVAAGFGPAIVPPAALQDDGELRAQLEADLRAGLAPEDPAPGAPRLLAWDHGPLFRTIHAEVGATLPETNCVPTRVVYEARGNPRFPTGTVLRVTSLARYCLPPVGSATPAFAILRASERRIADDPQADPRSAEWEALAERFFASMRFVAPMPGGDTQRP